MSWFDTEGRSWYRCPCEWWS